MREGHAGSPDFAGAHLGYKVLRTGLVSVALARDNAPKSRSDRSNPHAGFLSDVAARLHSGRNRGHAYPRASRHARARRSSCRPLRWEPAAARRDSRRLALPAQYLRRQRRPEVAQRDAGDRRCRSPERGAAPAYDRELQSRLPRLPAELPHLHPGGGDRHSPLPGRRFKNRARDDGALRELNSSHSHTELFPPFVPATDSGDPSRRPGPLDSLFRGNERKRYLASWAIMRGQAEALTVPRVRSRRTWLAC